MHISKLSIFIATLLNSATGFFALVIIARAVGPAEYGALTTYLALVSIFFPVATLGTHLFALQNRWHDSDLEFGRIICKICLYAVTGSIAIYLFSVFILEAADKKNYWASLSLLIVGQALLDLALSFLQSKELYFKASLVVFGQNLIKFMIVICLFLWGSTELNKYVSGLIMATVISIVTTLRISKVQKFFPCAWSDLLLTKASFAIIKKSSPYLIDSLCYIAYYQIYILVLAGLVDEESVGNFNSGYVLLNATYILPAVFFQKTAPVHILKIIEMGGTELRKTLKKYIMISALSGVILTLPLSIFSVEVTNFIYGDKFPNASIFLCLISFAIPLRFVTTCLSSFLNSVDSINVKMKISIGTLAIGFIFSFFSVTIFGEKGITCALLLTELLWLLMLSICVNNMLLYKPKRLRFS